MATRMWLKDKVIQRDYREKQSHALYEDHRVLPGEEEPMVLRSGVPFHDTEEGVVYRVIRACTPEDGWAVATHWMRYYKISYPEICMLCRRGLLDGAMEVKAPVKRYRVRNHVNIKKWIVRKRAYDERMRRKAALLRGNR